MTIPLHSLLPAVLVALSAHALAQDWEGHGLALDVSSLGLEAAPKSNAEYQEGAWAGQVDGVGVRLELYVFPRAKLGLNEPSDVVELTEMSIANWDRRAKRTPFAFDESRPFPGEFGFVSYAWLGVDTKKLDTKPVESFFCLGGLLEEHGYSVEIRTSPALQADGQRKIEAFLKEGITYSGEVSDPEWSDEEVESRWQAQAPDGVLEDSKLNPVRSKHYVILTNVGKGTAKGFGKKIDEAYEEIRDVYPFEDVPGQRLLPIMYFVTREQYIDWCVKNLGWSAEKARQSGGVSTGDVYSTYHQATNAPVHIHEATHQIFKNRLRLPGGGSWFQEGVAEYMSSTANELGLFENLAKRDKHVPLREMFETQSMLFSAKEGVSGDSAAGNNYTQAACIVEFMRHGEHSKKFQEWVHAMGRVPRNDLESIETELRRVLGIDIAGFEEGFLEYWQKRKRPKKK